MSRDRVFGNLLRAKELEEMRSSLDEALLQRVLGNVAQTDENVFAYLRALVERVPELLISLREAEAEVRELRNMLIHVCDMREQTIQSERLIRSARKVANTLTMRFSSAAVDEVSKNE